MRLELLIVKDPYREVSKHRVRAFGQQGGDIGRAPDSFWVLPDPKGHVSSHHCSVAFRDGTYWLKDTSLNGVYLNNSRKPVGRGNEVPIRHEDRLRVAGYELLVRLNQAPVRIPESPAVVPAIVPVPPEQEATGEHPAVSVHDAEHMAGVAPANSHTATVVLNGSEYVSEPAVDAGTIVVAPTGVSPVAMDASQDASPEAAGPHSSQDTTADWAGATHPNLSVLETGAASGWAAASRRTKAEGFFEAALHRFKKAADSDAETSKFRSSGALGETEANIKPREFRPSSLDSEALKRNGILLGVADEAALRAFKILRTRIRRRMSANHWRSVGITGAGEGVGKTFTSINLAAALAQDSRSPAFLVDLDLYRPQVGSYLGMSFDKGLSDYLLGDASIDEIIYSPGVAGLAVIPNGKPLQHASELLASPRMAELVQFLEAESPSRYVLYDMPPILLSDDVLVFSPHVDCLLDVVAVGVTSRESLERSREILSEFNVLGIVLNRATERDQAGHYYYY